jgi:dihydroorotase
MRTLTILQPDDWHVHLRDGAYLAETTQDISRYFARAIIMPNLVPPVLTSADAANYRDRILNEVPSNRSFNPLMTLYLTDQTSKKTITEAAKSSIVHACKLYPAGATTHSAAGVNTIEGLYPIFEEMQKTGLRLAIHGEVTDSKVDIFDKEKIFIEQYLEPIIRHFPSLKIIFEHITTAEAVEFVQATDSHIGATITAHHLLYNRNDMLTGSIKPALYCLPVLKRNQHQLALIQAAISGDPSFFLGTDSAPHPASAKENACGCAAGCYTGHAAIELYAEVFASNNALQALENFASCHGADFYGLSRNTKTIKLVETEWTCPARIRFGETDLVPVRAGENIHWQVVNDLREST